MLVGNFNKKHRGGNGNYTKTRFWMVCLWLLVSFEGRMLFGWDSQSCSNKNLQVVCIDDFELSNAM